VLKRGGVFQVAVYHRYSVHTAMLFLPAILNGQIAKLGIAGVLSTIEKGADGVAIKPYVKLYSTRGLRRILLNAGLRPKRLAIRHVRFDQLPALNVFRRFEKALGWYACAFAEKA